MRHLQFSYLLLCGLLWLACSRIGPESKYPSPPASSYRIESVELVINGTSRRSQAAFVTPRFFEVARVQPLVGRLFIDQEYQPTFRHVAVLSNAFWRERFGAYPAIVGETLKLNGNEYTVIGIMPEAFKAPEGAEIWLPDDSGRHQHELPDRPPE